MSANRTDGIPDGLGTAPSHMSSKGWAGSWSPSVKRIVLSRYCYVMQGSPNSDARVDWGYFGGTLKTVLLYTLRPEDQATAWVSAEQRAPRLRHQTPRANA